MPRPRKKKSSPKSPRRTDRHQPRSTSIESTNEAVESGQQVRLQRYLASAGLGSRRKCEDYILAGRVSIDGEVARDLGVRVNIGSQQVEVDGELIRPQPKRYYLLNKPKGCVCTNSDPSGRTRAIDLVPDDGTRLFTVGRLDENSEGLILVTNDGEMAHRLAHPRFRVSRKYRVQVAGKPTPETLSQLKKGFYFAEGKFRIRDIRYINTRGKSTTLELLLTEGQNREIRRLFARVGHKVMQLERVVFGPLKLGRLTVGKYRSLTKPELVALRDLAKRTTEETGQQRPQRKRVGQQAGRISRQPSRTKGRKGTKRK